MDAYLNSKTYLPKTVSEFRRGFVLVFGFKVSKKMNYDTKKLMQIEETQFHYQKTH